MVVRVVHIAQSDRGIRLGKGIDGFEDAMTRYAIEAMSAGILGVRASRAIDRGVVVEAPVTRVSRDGNARVVRDARGARVVTTRAVDRGEEITVIDEQYVSDDEKYVSARRDVRRGIKLANAAERVQTDADDKWYKSMLGERYIQRALSSLQKKPRRT
jgi:hypothetical protein